MEPCTDHLEGISFFSFLISSSDMMDITSTIKYTGQDFHISFCLIPGGKNMLVTDIMCITAYVGSKY